ncbi:MAG: gamma-glutamyl-gamma-aminobutyrate hydrolase family protein [Oligoflexia bacterium]|nr:gamma-glutamyl-gamma-aminobutyrate hydrolase family protein [Oligoflexia bacterium]
MKLPRILLASRAAMDDAQSTPLLGVRQSYLDCVLQAGGYPFIAPRIGDQKLMEDLVGMAHGVLLPGGEDVDPARYNQQPSPHLGAVDKERDACEFYVLEAARKRGLPILGICRGCQVLNVAFGGSLYQDINAERPHLPGHGLGDDFEHAHDIRITSSTRLHAALGLESAHVNSFHHQAVKELGKGLVANAHDDTGLIEGIEGTGPEYVVGVQCHPELLVGRGDGVWERLFLSFVQASQKIRS